MTQGKITKQVQDWLRENPESSEAAKKLSAIGEKETLEREFVENIKKLAETNRKLEEVTLVAGTDELTQLANRAKMGEVLTKEINRTNRNKKSMGLMIMDMDKFKTINDNLSHPVGDSALIILSGIIKETIRNEDTVARYGGEEFIVILPDTKLEGLNILGERIRKNVEKKFKEKLREVIKNNHPEIEKKIRKMGENYFSQSVLGSISIGATLYTGKNEINPLTPTELIGKIDEALYFSKEHGRNQVSFLPPEGGEVMPLNKESLKNNFLKKQKQIKNQILEEDQILTEKEEDLIVFRKHGSKKQIKRTEESIKKSKERLKKLAEENKILENKIEELVA